MWHKKLVARKYDGSKNRGKGGRPRISDYLRQLIIDNSMKISRKGLYTSERISLPGKLLKLSSNSKRQPVPLFMTANSHVYLPETLTSSM